MSDVDTERFLMLMLDRALVLSDQSQQLARDRQIAHAAFSELIAEVSQSSARFARLDLAIARLASTLSHPLYQRRLGWTSDQELDDAILATLAKGPLSAPKLIQAVVDVRDVLRALRRLVREGRVMKEGRRHALPRQEAAITGEVAP